MQCEWEGEGRGRREEDGGGRMGRWRKMGEDGEMLG